MYDEAAKSELVALCRQPVPGCHAWRVSLASMPTRLAGFFASMGTVAVCARGDPGGHRSVEANNSLMTIIER